MNKGLKALEQRVLDRGQCAACGACLSLCPYLRSYRGRIAKLHDCDLEEGRCFAYCPRTEVDLDEIYRHVYGASCEDVEIGPVRRILMARAKDALLREVGQNGGVVSALTDLALREGTIHAAILTRRDADLLPQGYIATNTKDVLACAGSSYVTGHTLEALNRGPWQGDERIGAVGLPCQVLALSRMRASQLDSRTPVDRVDLVIGLFCTWALDYKRFITFLRKRFGDRPISKLDITPPPERLLNVSVEGALNQVPLDEIRSFIRPSCQVCIDMTSEFSDISIGTVEGKEGWNTVVVRTEKGEALLHRAEAEGVIETESLPEDKLGHLKEASLLKKRRALDALRALGELEDAYLTLPPKMIDRILSETKEVTP
ncbi:MAG: Coenzyme F420 hydrogenase/dehydrogenase, beta subunit C-terminal domain [Desulfobacteraceae bacterium]|jgi:coenzyme F420 hydrogenase subunit beta